MANGNRRTLADCDEHIARLREQIEDLRAERRRLLTRIDELKRQEATIYITCTMGKA